MSLHVITKQQNNVFVVIGMARSGTSAIARGLKALGIQLGDNLVPANAKWNPKGFFEDTEIVYKINGSVFRALDFAPYGIKMLAAAEQTSHKVHSIKKSAIALLSQRFAETHFWGFKDPSTVKLLPFWQDIFAELNIQENYVISLRNPLAAARSYQKLTGCDLEVGLLLWLMHMLPALEGTQGKRRIVVSYESLMKDPRQQLTRIKNHFNLPALADHKEIDAYINEFLDNNLHHFEFHRDEWKSNPAISVVPLCIQAYELFLQLAKDEITFSDAAFTAKWQELKLQLEKIYPVYSYLDVLLKKNNLLQRTLRNIHKSVLWKMLYPLRIVDETLRARRRKTRAEKKLTKAYG